MSRNATIKGVERTTNDGGSVSSWLGEGEGDGGWACEMVQNGQLEKWEGVDMVRSCPAD
jgi:hypothetical protein